MNKRSIGEKMLFLFHLICFIDSLGLNPEIRILMDNIPDVLEVFFFFLIEVFLKGDNGRTSLVVQWLRLGLAMQGVWVQSLVEELRSHMPHRVT